MANEAAGTTVGLATTPQAGTTAPAAAAPVVQPGAAGADSGASGGAAGTPIDLKAIYSQYPGLKEQIDKEVVSPAIKNYRETNLDRLASEAETLAAQRVEQRQQATRVAELAQAAQSPDEATRTRALTELGKLNLQAVQAAQQTTEQQTARQDLMRAVTIEFMKEVMGIETADIPAQARNDYGALREYILDQSPAVQAKVAAFQKKTGSDDAALAAAAAGADFAAKLATTPSPANLSGAAAVGAGSALPLEDAEWQTNRGNFSWRQANQARIMAAFAAGQLK